MKTLIALVFGIGLVVLIARFPTGTCRFDHPVDRAAYACGPEVGHGA
jgi:hypothetical protein